MTEVGYIARALERAKAEVARLERIASAATCRELGCAWEHAGGRNCGCADGGCSVPVHTCARCGDSDYGDNPDAERVREACSKGFPN